MLKKEKTPGDIIILQKCIKNHYHMLYIWHVTNGFSFFILGYFLPFTLLAIQKIEILKNKKTITLHKSIKVLIA